MTKHSCVVEGCPTKGTLFIIQNASKKKWCANLKIDPETLKPRSRVCSRHFQKSCIGSLRLRKYAVPTLNLGHNYEPIYTNRGLMTSTENDDTSNTDICLRRCLVKGCPTEGRLYGIPRESRIEWCANLKIDPTTLTSKSKVCDRHFPRTCIGKLRLKDGSMPILNLGHNDAPIYMDIKRQNKQKLENQKRIKCIVKGCSGGKKYFAMPPQNRKEWCANLKVDMEKLTKEPKVCIRHFPSSCTQKYRLKKGSMPTIDLGHDEGPIYENIIEDEPLLKAPPKTNQYRIIQFSDDSSDSNNSNNSCDEKEIHQHDPSYNEIIANGIKKNIRKLCAKAIPLTEETETYDTNDNIKPINSRNSSRKLVNIETAKERIEDINDYSEEDESIRHSSPKQWKRKQTSIDSISFKSDDSMVSIMSTMSNDVSCQSSSDMEFDFASYKKSDAIAADGQDSFSELVAAVLADNPGTKNAQNSQTDATELALEENPIAGMGATKVFCLEGKEPVNIDPLEISAGQTPNMLVNDLITSNELSDEEGQAKNKPNIATLPRNTSHVSLPTASFKSKKTQRDPKSLTAIVGQKKTVFKAENEVKKTPKFPTELTDGVFHVIGKQTLFQFSGLCNKEKNISPRSTNSIVHSNDRWFNKLNKQQSAVQQEHHSQLELQNISLKYPEMYAFWDSIIKTFSPIALRETRFEVTALLEQIYYKYKT